MQWHKFLKIQLQFHLKLGISFIYLIYDAVYQGAIQYDM